MPLVELKDKEWDIMKRLIDREELENPSQAIRHWDNLITLQGAIINKQDKEIDELKNEIQRLKSGDTASVELDIEAVDILSKIVKKEKYENASDAIRHMNKSLTWTLQEIDKLEKKIENRQVNDDGKKHE